MKLELQKGSRSQLLAILVMGIMLVFVGRLFYLQVIEHDTYVRLAYEEQVKPLAIPAERGEIYALDGDEPVKLVLNEKVYTLIADPKVITDAGKVIDVVRE